MATGIHHRGEKQSTKLLRSSHLCVTGHALFHFPCLYLTSQFIALHTWPFFGLTTSKVYMGPNNELPWGSQGAAGLRVRLSVPTGPLLIS